MFGNVADKSMTHTCSRHAAWDPHNEQGRAVPASSRCQVRQSAGLAHAHGTLLNESGPLRADH